MLIDRRGTTVRVRAPAKVNLFLEVLGRRADGYHDLATLMVTIGLFDSLEFSPSSSGEVRLSCDHPGLSSGPDNLVARAAALLRQRHGVRTGADVRLRKRIPMQAGLGGGSSDAAATLAGLDRLWGLRLGTAELARLGAELGSDVAFFFLGRPAGWCTGRGEIVEPVAVGRPLDVVLVCPDVGLSTASVFAALTLPDTRADGAAARTALERGEVAALGGQLFNRLEDAAVTLCPPIGRVRERLAELRPAGTLMSGSGSTVFALGRDAADAWRITRALEAAREEGFPARVHCVRSCD